MAGEGVGEGGGGKEKGESSVESHLKLKARKYFARFEYKCLTFVRIFNSHMLILKLGKKPYSPKM